MLKIRNDSFNATFNRRLSMQNIIFQMWKNSSAVLQHCRFISCIQNIGKYRISLENNWKKSSFLNKLRSNKWKPSPKCFACCTLRKCRGRTPTGWTLTYLFPPDSFHSKIVIKLSMSVESMIEWNSGCDGIVPLLRFSVTPHLQFQFYGIQVFKRVSENPKESLQKKKSEKN